MPFFAVHPDVATTLLHDPVDRREPETRSFSFLFGGEKWIENSFSCFFAHAGAGIADGQHNILTRQHADVLAGIFAVEFGAGGFDRQTAALRHGVTRIHDQIDQHLFDLSGIGLDFFQRRIQFCRQHDVFAN